MTHPYIAEALGAAHRDNLMRMAHGRAGGPQKVRIGVRRRDRFTAWVQAQVAGLRRPSPVAQTPRVQAQCATVTR